MPVSTQYPRCSARVALEHQYPNEDFPTLNPREELVGPCNEVINSLKEVLTLPTETHCLSGRICIQFSPEKTEIYDLDITAEESKTPIPKWCPCDHIYNIISGYLEANILSRVYYPLSWRLQRIDFHVTRQPDEHTKWDC